MVEIRFFNGSATEVTASISAPRCCTESSAFGRFVLVAKLIHLLGETAGLYYAVCLFRISGMYRPLVLVLTQPSTHLFFNCFDIPQIAGSAFMFLCYARGL